jgi:GTP-binding protein
MVGGGFDWHEHKEKFRARMKGEDVDSPTEDSRDTPFADLPIKFAIVGKPNVGKSTLTNRILGEDRVIVADHPGTTRDSIYIPLQRGDKKYIVIDTAGVRKRRKVSEAIEKFSIVKTLKAIEDCNVALLVIDARAHITDQDLSLLGFILESGRSLVIAVNKWDGLDMAVKDEIKLELNARLGFVDFARVHFISALHGTGVGNLFDSIDEAYEGATTRHSASLLNRILRAAIEEHEPPISGGRRIKLKFAHAGGYNPPRIIIHGNKVSKVPDAYKRYIINCYRKSLNIMGSPVIIDFKEGENPYANEKPAQKRQTQSQMRAERRKAANERMWARAEAKQDKEERKLIAKAKKEGSGLVLAKRPRKKTTTNTSSKSKK